MASLVLLLIALGLTENTISYPTYISGMLKKLVRTPHVLWKSKEEETASSQKSVLMITERKCQEKLFMRFNLLHLTVAVIHGIGFRMSPCANFIIKE